MGNKGLVSHPLQTWDGGVRSHESISSLQKRRLLFSLLRQFQKMGRIALSAKYYEKHDIVKDAYYGYYGFTLFYIGRKAILRRGIRHTFRKAYKDFLRTGRWAIKT